MVTGIHLTDRALEEIRDRLKNIETQPAYLRLETEPGEQGPSLSMHYSLRKTDHDIEFQYENLTVLVREDALSMWEDCTLDYHPQRGFETIRRAPGKSCGCGSCHC